MGKYVAHACLFLALAVLPRGAALAVELACANGGNPKDRRFIEAFERNTDPATLAFKQALLRNATLVAQNTDLARRSCLAPRCTSTRVSSFWAGIPIATGVNAQLNADCLDIALQRTNETNGTVCMGGRPSGRAGTGSNAPCLDQRFAGFIQYLFNLAIDCMSDPGDPVDPLIFFQKINNETGFSFWLHSRNGSGIGQFTDIAVTDLYGRGLDVLEQVAESPKPSCAPFAAILRSDLNKRRSPRGPNRIMVPDNLLPSENVCAWNSPGEGIARSFIYSLMKFRSDKRILSAAAPRFDRYSPRVQNLLALVSYGPEGESLATRLARANVDSEIIRGRSYYVRNTFKTYENYVVKPIVTQRPTQINPVSYCFEPATQYRENYREVAEAAEPNTNRPPTRPAPSTRHTAPRGRPGR